MLPIVAELLRERHGGDEDLHGIAKSVVELSEMIKSRSDIFDVITNPTIAKIKDQKVHVYRAFDRARRSIMASTYARNVVIRMDGDSRGRAHAVQMFDVVPYIIIQNAVKYSPPRSDIVIDVREDENRIYALVHSIGPSLTGDEQERVFMPGFRGKNAEKFESQGAGMGLFVVKRLVDYCDGASIRMNQTGDEMLVQGLPFRETSLALQLQRTE